MTIVRVVVFCVVAAGVLCGPAAADAASILEFNFNDSNSIVDVINPDLTSTAFTDGIGLSNEEFTGGNASARGWNPSASAAAALAAGDFWTFTVTAQSGYQFDVTGISLDDWRAENGPVTMQLWSGGFIGSPITVTETQTNNVIPFVASDLTSLELRMVAWSAVNNGNSAQLFLDNVVLNGFVEEATVSGLVSTPEPGSMILLGSGLVALAYRRYRSRRV